MDGVILVTGGSRGIGAATALAAAHEGYGVAVVFRQEEARAAAVVQEIAAIGGKAAAIAGDVAQEDDVRRIFETAAGRLGPVTGLVNAAGIAGPFGTVAELAAADIGRVLDINVAGTVLCCREAVRRMAASGGGSIVNVSSVAARLGAPGSGVLYAASKGAIDSFTIGLAQEVAAQGIRVNAVRPGLIDTEMQPPGRVEQMRDRLPMKRAGQAEEVAAAIVWLLGEHASYVSGAIMDVSGAR